MHTSVSKKKSNINYPSRQNRNGQNFCLIDSAFELFGGLDDRETIHESMCIYFCISMEEWGVRAVLETPVTHTSLHYLLMDFSLSMFW